MNVASIGQRIWWDRDLFKNLGLPRPDSAQEALRAFMGDRLPFTFSMLRCLEDMPISLPSTQDILDGVPSGDIGVRDYLKIRSFATAMDFAGRMVEAGKFVITKKTLGILHKITARHDPFIEVLGDFRNRGVKLAGVGYRPPVCFLLDKLWRDEFPLIEKIENPYERSVVGFLWAIRTQFFEDCNKRTNVLAMNGQLVAGRFWHVTFPSEDQRNFKARLCRYYETGTADGMIGLINEYALDAAGKMGKGDAIRVSPNR